MSLRYRFLKYFRISLSFWPSRSVSYFTAYKNKGNVPAQSGNDKAFKEIPGPLRLPVVGNVYAYNLGIYDTSRYHELLDVLYEKYGPLVRQDFYSDTVIHVFDPEDIKTVYENEGLSPYIRPLQEAVYLFRRENYVPQSLGNVNGAEWYRLRSAVRKVVLRPSHAFSYAPLVHRVAQDFVQRIDTLKTEQGILKNLSSEIAKWSLESGAMICFNRRLGFFSGGKAEDRAERIIGLNKTIFKYSWILKFSHPLHSYFSTKKWKKLSEAEDTFLRIAREYIHNSVNELAGDLEAKKLRGEKICLLVDLLVREELSIDDITAMTMSLYTDGLSTTVPAMLHNLYCLATNAEVQDRAYDEVRSVVKDGKPINVDNLNNLRYLKAVVKETFRLYPIGPEVSRIIQKDLILSGYHVPAGTHVNLCPIVHYRSHKYFTNPLQFKPERWLREGEEDDVHPYVHTPFSHGTRTCVGRRLAEQDLYVLLCTILKKFKLSYPQNKKPLRQTCNALLSPDEELDIMFQERK